MTPPIVDDLVAPLDFLQALDDNENDVDKAGELLVIMYAAHYCKLCHRSSLAYRQLAAKQRYGREGTIPDRSSSSSSGVRSVRYARTELSKQQGDDVDSSWTSDSLRKLGVTSFPFIQIYFGGDCVASFGTGPAHDFKQRVQDTVEGCMKCQDWYAVRSGFAGAIREHREAREAIRQELS